MGVGQSKIPLNPIQLDALVKATHFNELEIKRLYTHFKAISASIQDDDTIELNEFKRVLGSADEVFARRLFQVFDEDHNDHVDFREFVMAVSAFCERGTLDEKIRYSFKIYDLDNDGFIDKDELLHLLKASLCDISWLPLSDEQMRAIIEETYAEVDANGDGRISKDEYEVMVRKNPAILEPLTINTEEFLS